MVPNVGFHCVYNTPMESVRPGVIKTGVCVGGGRMQAASVLFLIWYGTLYVARIPLIANRE